MAFFSKLFKSKTSQTTQPADKERKLGIQSIHKTEVVRQDVNSIPDNELLQVILADTDADYCLEVLSKISNEEDALTIAMQHSVAAVRNAAAEKINSSALLQKLQTHSKAKDKTLFRFCKNRLAELRAINQVEKERQERIEYLLSQVRYLTRIGYQPEFSGKLQLLNQEWPELVEYADADTAQAMQTELAKAEQILQDFAEEEAKAAAQKQAQLEAKEIQKQLLNQTINLLEQAEGFVLETLAASIQEIEQGWNNAFRLHKPSADIAKGFESSLQQLLSVQSALGQYEKIQTEFEEWLANNAQDAALLQKQLKQGERWLKNLAWPQKIAAPSWYQQLTAKVQTLKEKEHSLLDAQDSKIQQLQKQLAEFEQAVTQGLTKEATKFNRQIQQALKQISPNKATALQQQFRTIQAQLQELRDWAGFATTPKKESLVASMEELIDADIAPAILAEKVQALQEEWKELSVAGAGDDRELWQSFNAAADKAFEPCKAYFAEQAKLRESHVELRHKLINELASYELGMDWQQADWKIVQKTLDTARETFRTYGPVERTLHKETQDRFNEICDRIYGHLKDEYERNLATKADIVEQAQQLVTTEDLQGIVNKVKALQNQWKDVGVTPRGPDQKLWRDFREACDAIFARLDSQREERKSELSEIISTAETMVEDALNATAEQSKTLLREASQHIQSVNLPKNVQQALSKKLQDATSALEKQTIKEQQKGLLARIQNLRADDDAWQQACTLPLPKGYSEDLFTQARNNEPNSEESAQDLCLLLEIAKDQESTAADQARRMELQVQRLAQGLGKSLSTEDEVRSLIERWLTVKADDALTQRFVNTLSL